MSEETYDESRARNLEALLRAFAARIATLDQRGELLGHVAELQKLIGDIRSELFHYEVRATYDTPEIADHRRLVAEAEQTQEVRWEKTEWKPGEDEEPKE